MLKRIFLLAGLLFLPCLLHAQGGGQFGNTGGSGTGGGSGTVSGQANNVIPKGTTATSITQQSSITDNGTTVSITEPITTTGSVSTGSGCTPAGATATGGICGTEAASTGWTPTAGFDYMRADSTQHTFLCSLNGAAEVLCGGANFPLTVSGTVTSGGIPYFNSTTQESSSALLTTNIYIKGGGAGAAPAPGLTTDDGTTSTYTGTGGTKSPVFTSTGTTAGFVDYPQGTTSAAVAPCNVATSICEQAPTSVTSYLVTKPGTAPNIASYKQTDGCAAASCTETYHPVPLLLTVTGDFTTAANTSLQTITGLTYTTPVSKATVSSFHCNFSWSQATGTAAVAFGVQGATTAPTNLEATATSFSNTTAETTGTLTALASTTATAVVSVAPSAITTIWKAELDGTLEAPSNASPTVMNIMVSTATSGDAVTVKRGSYCMVLYQ